MNIFIVFLVCSALIWLISKLSETYTQASTFELSFVNAPDSLLLTGSSMEEIDTRLQASGFRFLGFNFGKRILKMDLNNLKSLNGQYFINKEEYQKQIENQIPASMSLLSVDQDTLFLYLSQLISKEVEVVPDINLELAQNHILEGKLTVDPSRVTIKGPKTEIEQIDKIYTVSTNFTGISESFNSSLALTKPEELINTVFSENRVNVSGTVFRFSEQLVDVPVRVINLPEGTEIKTFPNTITVLCKAKIDRLKSLRPQEFEITADFNSVQNGKKELEVRLLGKPDDIYDVQLNQTKVEFILIRR